jgi:NAD-dependent deacetylase
VSSPSIEEAAARLRGARRVTVLTGAGVSAASGVPTFRGAGGLWRTYRPEDLATPEAFARDPRLVWEWYSWRRERIASCAPNAAHEVIARWSTRPGVTVITQNVDDLHLRAGTRGLIRLHGSIWQLCCAAGRTPRDEAGAARRHGVAGGIDRGGAQAACHASWRDERVPLPELPPRCISCGGLARPDVVWFGEPLAPADVAAAAQACRCDLFLTVGTSALVYPAAGFVHEAARQGAWTVEINAEPTPASAAVHLTIQGPAEIILPAIDRVTAT